jgi:hypothetical protein
VSLKDQENTLNFAERVAIVKLTAYLRGEPVPTPTAPTPGSSPATNSPHVNLATFEDRDITVVPKPLRLFELTAGVTEQQLLQQQAGTEVVFTSDIWVSGVVKKVAGIR